MATVTTPDAYEAAGLHCTVAVTVCPPAYGVVLCCQLSELTRTGYHSTVAIGNPGTF
jgi:hypothetical protein